ncbi:NADH dehydrogenase [ubiquinone] 1 alpha subcomplex subunit 3 [Alligator mississippiensis]|uniref:NADH dehydrogenase [ubiquinone] 1 alpha subcomplex subunit 3 n=1 Tax=Alligator mississippiensis TaxID=8496 RepID=A0A151M4X1_ALLMI|nr:NADH dehydrogenase [ubiquinone] 1 alpha subcomplex subunit 3 [Alligator mississippiensis]
MAVLDKIVSFLKIAWAKQPVLVVSAGISSLLCCPLSAPTSSTQRWPIEPHPMSIQCQYEMMGTCQTSPLTPVTRKGPAWSG